MNRRTFLWRATAITAGAVLVAQLDLIGRLDWRRREAVRSAQRAAAPRHIVVLNEDDPQLQTLLTFGHITKVDYGRHTVTVEFQ